MNDFRPFFGGNILPIKLELFKKSKRLVIGSDSNHPSLLRLTWVDMF